MRRLAPVAVMLFLSSCASSPTAPGTDLPPDQAGDTDVPDAVTPDAAAPDMTAPDAMTADSVTPDLVAPDLLPQDLVPPDSVPPDSVPPDLVTPDVPTRDTLPPDEITPEIVSSDTVAPDAFAPDAAIRDATTTDPAAPDTPPMDPCKNGTCDPDETCWTCPTDCQCACGDGVCTHGEACASCPADCDCTTLAATPPMGWNSWNRFGCDISETLAKETADALESTGLKAAGYTFLNLDDCWQVDRDADGGIVADPVRFANGMKALADYVHGKGLGFGLYTDAGTLTCQERPGSLDHEARDMRTYADWGVDYVKADWCFSEGLVAKDQYARFRDGIAATGRRIVLSICNWGQQEPWVWGNGIGQLWRTTGDISDSYFVMLLNLGLTSSRAAYAGPGHWNDPDMLEVGNGGMTTDQYRAHMSLWSILAAPLVAGNDLRSMDATTKEILANPEVIAVNQDALGLQGVRIVVGNEYSPHVWAKPLAHPGWRAVVVFNEGFETAAFDLAPVDLGLAPGTATVRDLWAHQDLGPLGASFPIELPATSARMFVVKGDEPLPPAGESYLSDLVWIYSAGSLGPVERDRSNGGEPAGDGPPLAIGGTPAAKGIGAFAGSIVVVPLGGRCTSFKASVGVDDAAGGGGTTSFELWGDGRRLFDSGLMRGGDTAKAVDVALDRVVLLKLVTTAGSDSEDRDFTDWVDARVACR